MKGEWDLRIAPDAYLGNIDLANRRVLEMGTANGFLTFYMESKISYYNQFLPSTTRASSYTPSWSIERCRLKGIKLYYD